MGRIFTLLIVILSLAALQMGCGGSVSVRSPTPKPGGGIQNILPPVTPDALKISLITEIDDDGNRSPQISISLKDEDDLGTKWSIQLGDRFRVVLGDSSFVVELNPSTGVYQAVPTPPISLSAFANLFDKVVRLTKMDGSELGSPILQPRTPLALNNFSAPFNSIDDRFPISRCRLDELNPTPPGLYWYGSSSAKFEVYLDNLASSVSDNGYWRPPSSIFSEFFGSSEMASADQSLSILGPVTVDVGLRRFYDDRRIRIATSFERELIVQTFGLQTARFDLFYVGGCGS